MLVLHRTSLTAEVFGHRELWAMWFMKAPMKWNTGTGAFDAALLTTSQGRWSCQRATQSVCD